MLTLHGPSGPRCGRAMAELSIIAKGAVLIRNGVIEDVGPTRRVENLAGARQAREIDATGRVVMPAFVDADVALVTPPAWGDAGPTEAGSLRQMSRKRALTRAAITADEYAGYGCLAVGAHTRFAADFQNIRKVLLVHKALQRKPMRIRSIFSPAVPVGGMQMAVHVEEVSSKWLAAVMNRELAAVFELTAAQNGFEISMLRSAAATAAGLGYALRLRSIEPPDSDHLRLALSAGAIGIVAPMDNLREFAGHLSAVGCVRVIPASEAFDSAAGDASRTIRNAIDEGAAVALTSSYRLQETSSVNMQYLLHLAVHRLGLTAEEAITATTWNPACSLKLSHVTGSLERGKSGDLLIMEVPDYRELPRRAGHRDVSLVMREGQVIHWNTPAGGRAADPLNVD